MEPLAHKAKAQAHGEGLKISCVPGSLYKLEGVFFGFCLRAVLYVVLLSGLLPVMNIRRRLRTYQTRVFFPSLWQLLLGSSHTFSYGFRTE